MQIEKEYHWYRGRKIIDKWHIKDINIMDEEWQTLMNHASTPIMFKDKHGNIWSMSWDKSDLVLRNEG